MTHDEMVSLCRRHTLFPWRARDHADPQSATSGEGVYLTDGHGRRILDFSSQLVCVNIGHRHPYVREALRRAVDELTFFNPRVATEARARVGQRLAAVFPDDLNTFFFTLSGADANEHAFKIARQVTGKFKILSRYRSYHGATAAALGASGDRRRLRFEPGPPGFVHVPHIWSCAAHGADEDATRRALEQLDSIIAGEGVDQIAAMIIETIPGSSGVLIPPRGYLEGLRQLLTKRGILLICDEVMTGFGRTGRMFAFEHFNITPDLVTCAKGLTCAYAPLGCVAVRDEIAAYFQKTPLMTGLTYSGHPLGLAAALAVLDVLEHEQLVERVAATGHAMRARMEALRGCRGVRDVRSFGMLGAIELQPDPEAGDRPLNDLITRLWNDGISTYAAGPHLMIAPPFCIEIDELDRGFDVVERALTWFAE